MRQALRITFWAWIAIIAIAWTFSRGDVIDPILPINRYAAGLFLVALIVGLVVEFGWGGGNKNNASHM